MMTMASGDDFPSGRVPERGIDWFFVVIEACGSETSDLGFSDGFSIYRIFLALVSR